MNPKITLELNENYAIVRLDGELEMADLTDMQSSFQSSFENSRYSILLDCSALQLLLSAHLGAIYQRHQVALKRGGRIAVFGCNEIVEQAFKRLGFDRIITIYPDRISAVDAMQ